MKKIVYVVGGLYGPSGMGQVLSQKINYLAENTDYEIHAILTEKVGEAFYYPLSSKVKVINFNLNFDELDTLPLIKKIFKYWLKQQKYKRLFSNYLMEIKPHFTVSALRREINFIHSISDGSTKIGEIHFNRSNYREFKSAYFPAFLNRMISKIWMNKLLKEIRKLKKFIVLSQEDKVAWAEDGLDNIEVIHNPLAHYPEEISACTSNKVIAAGRYTWQKGFDLLIDAWEIVTQQYPKWELYIYGAGNNQIYQKQAEQKGISQSVFCKKSTKNIYEKYKECSIFVLSSRYEGFGLVLCEAMSCGLPAVSFACPCGPRDIIHDGVDGFLVEKENTKLLAERISYLIEHEDIRKKMSETAHLNIRRFKEDAIMTQWIRLFEKLEYGRTK